MTIFQFFFMIKVHNTFSLPVNLYLFAGSTALATFAIFGTLFYFMFRTKGGALKQKYKEKQLKTTKDWIMEVILPLLILIGGTIYYYIQFGN
jgi:hypothetical protein